MRQDQILKYWLVARLISKYTQQKRSRATILYFCDICKRVVAKRHLPLCDAFIRVENKIALVAKT